MSIHRRYRRKRERFEKKFIEELKSKYFPGLTYDQIVDKLADIQIDKMNAVQIQEPINVEDLHNKPQTVEEFHAQEMNKWGGGVNMTNNV
jgi:hypothetical protein